VFRTSVMGSERAYGGSICDAVFVWSDSGW
jgi:hypothetical protein